MKWPLRVQTMETFWWGQDCQVHADTQKAVAVSALLQQVSIVSPSREL